MASFSFGRERGHPIICFRNVRKAFGPKVVLDGVDMELRSGETSVIIGPSGAGKSVCLKLLVGLLEPDQGEVWVDGVQVNSANENDLYALRKRIGMLFQDGALFDSMSVADNIAFPLRRHTRLGEDAIRAKVCAVLDQVGLPGVEQQMPAELSGGMRKRVSLARAIITEPQIILFDEPNSGLDPVRSDEIDALIQRMKVELGITFVIISHDIVGTFRVADHIAMLHGGTLIAQGSPSDLLRSPKAEVRRFLSRNLGLPSLPERP
ncbi:MAG: ABC transporter ATP-binding protein [Rickettsiales bacterium]|nr:ABC transporter ATP-binding protein [Rickettsiales bacterium]|tara:strand:- start:66 stop:857 length:792 start_codon:yes stop_codon:yes gene_type:complete